MSDWAGRSTRYSGITYRSEIEAKVAMLLDWLCVLCTYELGPLDTAVGPWRPDWSSGGAFLEAKWECVPQSNEGNWPRIREWLQQGRVLFVLSKTVFESGIYHALVPTASGEVDAIELPLWSLLLSGDVLCVGSTREEVQALFDAVVTEATAITHLAVGQILSHQWWPRTTEPPQPSSEWRARVQCCRAAALLGTISANGMTTAESWQLLRTILETQTTLEQREVNHLMALEIASTSPSEPEPDRSAMREEAGALIAVGIQPVRDVSLRLER